MMAIMPSSPPGEWEHGGHNRLLGSGHDGGGDPVHQEIHISQAGLRVERPLGCVFVCMFAYQVRPVMSCIPDYGESE